MITAEYLGVTGKGKTIKEAKADAARQVRDFMATSERPRIFTHKGNVVIAWARGIESASYSIIWAGSNQGEIFFSVDMQGSVQDALRDGRKHLAGTINDASAVEEKYRVEVQYGIDRSIKFQNNYKEAIEKGMTEIEAHASACRAM